MLNEYVVYVKNRQGSTDEFHYKMDRFKKLYSIKDLTSNIRDEIGVSKMELWKLYTSNGDEVRHLKDCSDGVMVMTRVKPKLPSIRSKSSSEEQPHYQTSSVVTPRFSSLSNREADGNNLKFPPISHPSATRTNSDTSVHNKNRKARVIRRKQNDLGNKLDDHLLVPNPTNGPKKSKSRSNSRSSTKSIKRNLQPVEEEGGTADKNKESLNEEVIKHCSIIKAITDESQLYAKYDLGNKIGDGNFAQVHIVNLVKNPSKVFALKKIYTKRMKNKTYYIENEAELLHVCKHPNIVRLFEGYKTVDHYYLIIELLQNGDLFDNVKACGSFSENVAAGVTSDVAHALHYLHRLTIVHRDIKPENLFLTVDFRVKLGDFGLACKVLGPLYRVCGTPTYVAPEVLSETGYGVEIDLWSLGIILYIMLCGYAPFRNQDRDKLFKLIQLGHYEMDGPKWEHVSEGAKSLVSKLLVLDATNRATAAHVIKDRWIRSHIQTEA